MNAKKFKIILLTALLCLCMATGCSNAKVYVAATDNTLYEFDSTDTLPCYLNNAMMSIDNDILESDTLKGFVDFYTLELYDEGMFILLCNMYDCSLEEMSVPVARDCLLDYFKGTAVDLDLNKVEGKYCLTKDVSPRTGKETDFYKIVFSGAKIKVNGASLEGQAALITYEDICIAAIIGTADGKLSETGITNMMKSTAIIESGDFSTGSGSKPSYQVPDDLQLEIYDDNDAKEDEDIDDIADNDEDQDYEDEDEDDADNEDEEDEDEDDGLTKRSPGSAGSSDLLATSVTINDMTLSYPMTYDDLADMGFTPEEGKDYMVPEYGSEVISFLMDNGGEFSVFFINTSDKETSIADCVLYGFDIDIDYLSSSTTVVVGNSIVLGETSKEELLGLSDMEPSFEYDSEEYYSVTYESLENDYFNNDFTFWDGILKGISMRFPYEFDY